ncbi:MAG: DUF4010 domain-containing protein [Hoeflea sp.]|uniref:MgtC/SapB family protein n=1 Tax=Hoeflea sp. TaxID=1940281 RepID=UPI00272F2E75|nr:DUF4010 domain-containing protein [Hoeflea sp.]MDP2121227.1 DUF4010 domain-containing protein [Hoeflea sp.]
MGETEIFARLGLALAIGLLFGLERGWHGREQSEGGRVAGIRTFALTALMGGVSAWLAAVTSPTVLAVALAALGVMLAISYFGQVKAGTDIGLTTEIALLLTFVLGAASVLGEMAPVAAGAVVAGFLLNMKARLHGWIARMDQLELEAVFKLGLISVVVLPLLPDQGYGPGGTLNPYEIWWAVVVVAGLSFLGYLGIRLAGAGLGILMTGFFGGLASSTSTTLVLARMARQRPALVSVAAAGIVVAGAITFLRILVLVGVFEPALLALLLPPMAAMAATGLIGAALIRVVSGGNLASQEQVEGITNPLELKTAVLFGAALTVVLLGVYYLRLWLGTAGIYAAAAVSGLTDVDALTISMARLVGSDLSPETGMLAIFIAVAVNTAVKAVLSLVAGTTALGLRVIAVHAAALAAGGASLWVGL